MPVYLPSRFDRVVFDGAEYMEIGRGEAQPYRSRVALAAKCLGERARLRRRSEESRLGRPLEWRDWRVYEQDDRVYCEGRLVIPGDPHADEVPGDKPWR